MVGFLPPQLSSFCCVGLLRRLFGSRIRWLTCAFGAFYVLAYVILPSLLSLYHRKAKLSMETFLWVSFLFDTFP